MEKSLDNIVTLFSGNAWKAASFKPNGKIPIIRIQNIGENKSKEFIYWDEDYNETFIVKKGDLLLSLSGSIKLDFWDGQPALLNQRIVKISPKEGIDTHWLFFQLKNYVRKITNMGNHALVNNVSLTDLRKLTLKVPEYPDQLHIANLLSKAENLIAQRKESIRLLDEFLKSTFLEMFGDPVRNEKGWEKFVLGNVCKKIGSGSTPRGGKESYHKEGISLIRSLNVHNDEFVYKDLAFIDDKQAHELKNVIVEENDVLLNITGASVARCCIVPKGILPARVNQHVSILRPETNVLNPLFLSRMFTSENYQLKLVKDAKSKGATREAITKEEIELMKVIAPPIKLQTQFAQIVEKTEVLKTQYQQSLQELENLYGSLSQKAFRGELKMKQNV